MHTGVFHGVDNAAEIRDLILQRLRSFRDSGLGDPDELVRHPAPTSPASPSAAAEELRSAGQELLSEARKLRAVAADAKL